MGAKSPPPDPAVSAALPGEAEQLQLLDQRQQTPLGRPPLNAGYAWPEIEGHSEPSPVGQPAQTEGAGDLGCPL